MSKVTKTLKILKNLNRSQVLVALFLGVIILLSSVNLIRDLRSYGLRPFGFVESAFALIFPDDSNVVAIALPNPGKIQSSACGDKIDLLQYMYAQNAPRYDVKYCTKNGPGPVPQSFQIVDKDASGNELTFQGHSAFKVQKGNDYELYYYDNNNIYFVEDTSWDGTCADGLRAYYRVFDGNNNVGGAIPRCWSPGQEQVSQQKIKTYYRDSDTPSGQQCSPTEDFQVTNPTYKVDYASLGGNGPQISSLYNDNGTVVLKNTAGAGAGEEKYYSKGYGLSAFYFNNGGTVDFQSSIQTDDVDPVLQCAPGANFNSLDLSSPKIDIVDSPDRCIAYNPLTGKQLRSINAGGGTSLESGKGGINQGSLGWNNEIQFAQGNNSLKKDLKMGNILGLFLFNDPGRAAQFVIDANDSGLLPVIRLCYSDSCAFNLYDDSIPNFYKTVSLLIDQQRPGSVFVGLVGPNEPGTNGEAAAFGAGSAASVPYQDLVDRANYFADQLQDIRVKLGGNMYIAPAAFNMTNRQNDDIKEYLLNGRGLNLGLFDYLAGNTYNTDGKSAYSFYADTGMKQVVDSNGLKTIITEFGKFSGTNDDLKNTFNQFCDDSNVDGVLFFRSFEDGELGAGQPKPLPIPISVIYDMTSSCSKPRPWVDCNFDSTLYADNPKKVQLVAPDSSLAKAIYSKTEDKTGSPTFKVNCVSNNCDYKIIKTVRVRAPIKSFGSNSSFGTDTKNYTPICANVASLTNSSIYDPYNQFASKIGDGYPMPWLGSAINCSTDLVRFSSEYAGVPGLQAAPSPGSVSTNTKSDIEADNLRGIVARQYDGSSCYEVISDGKSYIPDERSVYYKGKLIDKCPTNIIKTIRDYNPFDTPQKYESIPSNTNMKVLKNPDDYIFGPEVVVSTSQQVNVGDFSQMCSQYAERNINPEIKYVANSTLKCDVVTGANDTVDGVPCNFFVACQPEDIQKGTCTLNKNFDSKTLDDLRNNCFNYTPQGTDKIYYKDNSFAPAPNVDIPGIYDSLFTLYERLNNSLKSRNLKMVVSNNIGWDVESYSMLRDGNAEVKDAKDSLYKAQDPEKTYYPDILGDSKATATVTESNIFNNNNLLARGTASDAVKKTDNYYDWLGYLDLFQEYYSVYANSTNLGAEQRIPNPFFEKGGPSSDQGYILISGLSSQITSLPLLSCDQREIGAKFTRTDLENNADVKNSIKLYLIANKPQLTGDALDKEVIKLIDQIWPYDFTLPSKDATCITNSYDTRFTGKFEVELCRRGYKVNGACNFACIPNVSAAAADVVSLGGNLTFTKGLQALTEQIEAAQNIPKGILIGLLERETPGSMPSLSGDPFQQSNQRKDNNPVWGPAQFHNISWYKGGLAGYGALDGDGFGVYTYNTKNCLEKLGVTYTNPTYFESGMTNVLERSYVGYALCAAGAKLKNDSKTANDLNRDQWTVLDVTNAAKAYLGDCSQNGRSYCENYIKTICTLYPESNQKMCNGGTNIPDVPGFSCIPAGIENPKCDDDNLRLTNPLRENADKAKVSQAWGVNLHSGTDLAIPVGTDVYAALNGTVVGVQKNWVNTGTLQAAAGNYVKIKHKVGDKVYWTIYEHLSSVLVDIGDEVTTGQPIGKVGVTGRTSGAHLHFELRKVDCYDGYGEGQPLGSCSMDPMPYVLNDTGIANCELTTGGPLIVGNFACPIKDATKASIYQTSDGPGSHSASAPYHQHEQLPTDIRAPGQTIIAPV
ncbi:MAG: M23 family metallopeptidase, partial [Candidatus Dojkabacteria bacterium]